MTVWLYALDYEEGEYEEVAVVEDGEVKSGDEEIVRMAFPDEIPSDPQQFINAFNSPSLLASTDESVEQPQPSEDQEELSLAAGGSGNADRAADYLAAAPEFDRPLLEAYINGVWDDSATETRVLTFAESELPEMVVANIREAIMGGAIFNDFAEIPSSDLMQLRHFMSEQLESDGWTIDGLADQLQDLEPSLDKPEAERIARTETASVVNNARESGYEERDLEDAQFKWVGPSDGRTTDACEELKELTNPKYGGDPVELDELKRLVREMQQQHFPNLDPRDWTVHVNERHTYVRHVE